MGSSWGKHDKSAAQKPRERVFSREEWAEWATQVEVIIVREVGILSHAEDRVIDPIVNLIELAYERGLDDERL
jgi:hypothetical protein